MTTRMSRFSRRVLFGIGGTTLLAATAATAWGWRLSRAGASAATLAEGSISYAEHHGWLVSVADKRELQAWAADRRGAPPPTSAR